MMNDEQKEVLKSLVEIISDEHEVDISFHDGEKHDYVAPKRVGLAKPNDVGQAERELKDMSIEEAYVVGRLLGRYNEMFEDE